MDHPKEKTQKSKEIPLKFVDGRSETNPWPPWPILAHCFEISLSKPWLQATLYSASMKGLIPFPILSCSVEREIQVFWVPEIT